MKQQKLAVIREAVLRVLGYCQRERRMQECIAGIFLPENYPPGSALCIQGTIYHGARGMAGEIDHLPLGIDWIKTATKKQQSERLERLIRSVIYRYDPHALVIYSESISQKQLDESNQRWQQELGLTCPLVMQIRNIHEDFALGIAQLAKQELYRQIILERE